MSKHLAQEFINFAEQQEITPPLYNCAIFVQSSGWNTKKYLSPFYKNKLSFPLFISMDGREGVMFYLLTKTKEISKEFFFNYLNNPTILGDARNVFWSLDNKIDVLYKKYSQKKIQEPPIKELINISKTITDLTWRLNGRSFFSIYFDKDECQTVLRRTGSSITGRSLNLLWKKSSIPNSLSFEIRRRIYAAKLRSEGKSWEDIADACRYHFAFYHHIPSNQETLRKIKNEYSEFRKQKTAEFFIKRTQKGLKIKQAKFAKWLQGCSKQEQQVAKFIQAAIEFRDLRKDATAKMLSVNYLIAIRMFKEAGISAKYLYFYSLPELFRGVAFLKASKNKLIRRFKGVTVLIEYGGRLRFEYGKHFQNLRLVELEQIKQAKVKTTNGYLVGQTGSPGKITGRVRVIRNIDGAIFRQGQVLITGMTRPEFVPFMKKASAIVTDEGGITSHAAILARELKKPCVIGTKIATKVLRDGDLVEVDADKGVVRILKRK